MQMALESRLDHFLRGKNSGWNLLGLLSLLGRDRQSDRAEAVNFKSWQHQTQNELGRLILANA